ncbi:hypothetical protein D9611_006957 [Ephemerocybe angulata]|uniref:Uncharacterized protein n=1 Tax=Ephemerocybe angulata TaxID=980116 RepID=A0A8H5B075_9AGAR|nr:hypothetical protein D9611_006957 [Tulosesus angulatus]
MSVCLPAQCSALRPGAQDTTKCQVLGVIGNLGLPPKDAAREFSESVLHCTTALPRSDRRDRPHSATRDGPVPPNAAEMSLGLGWRDRPIDLDLANTSMCNTGQE